MQELPEGCIANVLSFTDPRQVCRLSVVSPEINHAAQSDAVWNKFLPPDYPSLISVSSSPSLLTDLPSKKQLYLSLCDHPILIDGGKTSFSLEKSSGKKIYLISARGISIIWGDTPQYWQWNSDPDSRFGETAELLSVCWLEIRGKIKIKMLSTATAYGAYLVYKLGEWVNGFGRRDTPLEAAVGVAEDGEIGKRECWLVDGKKRGDGWLEIELGEFFNGDEDDGEGELDASIVEIKRLNWKRGLLVQGIEFRPKT